MGLFLDAVNSTLQVNTDSLHLPGVFVQQCLCQRSSPTTAGASRLKSLSKIEINTKAAIESENNSVTCSRQAAVTVKPSII